MGEPGTLQGITKAEKAAIAKLAEASHEYAERFGVAAPPFHLPPDYQEAARMLRECVAHDDPDYGMEPPKEAVH